MTDTLSYLGVSFARPRVAFFELTSCEGCQLQILNNESGLLDFLSLVRVVNFREAMSEKQDRYDIAFVEGSVSRDDEIERLRQIREHAGVLVAFGSCACFGGVNQLKNRFHDLAEVCREVYGEFPVATREVRPIGDFVHVDMHIYGCPVRKEEVERIVLEVILGKKVTLPKYPVCMECKANENICLFEVGEPCLGPVTRAGCDSWCPNSRRGCWGCRGPAEVANVEELMEISDRYGFDRQRLFDRLECFGGFAGAVSVLHSRENPGSEERRNRA